MENLESEELTTDKETQNEEAQEQETDEQTPENEFETKIKELEHDLAVVRADFYNFRQRTIKERRLASEETFSTLTV